MKETKHPGSSTLVVCIHTATQFLNFEWWQPSTNSAAEVDIPQTASALIPRHMFLLLSYII
jgi:hypothetical protein